ncbi:MAG: diguanylate cyclase [Treponema sp.]|nr:diguanylate cyclase [Treponema sp.]
MERFFAYFKALKENIFSLHVPLEKRVTYAMILCAMLGELFGFIESLLLRLPTFAVMLPLISFIFLFFLSIWGFRTKNTRLFALLSIVICALILFPLMFFVNAGVDGGMPFYFILTVVYTALVLRGKTRIVFFIITILEDALLFFLWRKFPEGFIPMSETDSFIDRLCSIEICSVVLFFFAFSVSKQNYYDRSKIQHLSDLYENQANTDELTGLYNRRYFKNFLTLAIAAMGGTGNLHLAMFDIDNFKQVNDKYGHPFGDEVLKKFAAILHENEKIGATACRYGGEEFLLLIPKKNTEEALKMVEDVLESTRTTIEISKGRFITVSAGFLTCADGMSFDQVMQTVDQRLYIAKGMGKDRVVS